MVASLSTGLSFSVRACGGKYPVPGPFSASIRIFSIDSHRRCYTATIVGLIFFMKKFDRIKLLTQPIDQASRQDGAAVLVAFAATHNYLVPCEVDILDAQADALQQPQAGTVHQHRHDPRRAA